MTKRTADQLIDQLSFIAGVDEEIHELLIELRQILVDEEIIES